MTLVYKEDEGRGGPQFAFDPLRCDANKLWEDHFNNACFLTLLLQHGTRIERHQASKEMVICERKMAYWSRQPHFDNAKAAEQALAVKKLWEGRIDMSKLPGAPK